jgi:hypothetical protein
MNSLTLTVSLKLLGGLFVLFTISGIISHLLGCDKYHYRICNDNNPDENPEEEDPET